MRMGHGPHNFAVLRHMAINAMQKERCKGSLLGKFKRRGWDHDFLLRLMELFSKAIVPRSNLFDLDSAGHSSL